MKQFKIFFLIIFPIISTLGQELGVWQNFTSMNFVLDVVNQNDGIWAASEGGAFFFQLQDSSYLKLTKSEGISSHRLTSIASDTEGKIWFGTQEGFINIYDPATNSINTILDIYNSDKNLKRINDLFVSGDTIFVSTDFGVSLINTKTLIFFDTIVKFGSFPSETKVNSLTKGKLIYVSTDKGIAIQKNGVQNLAAPESWDVYSFPDEIPADIAYRVLEYNNSLIAATDEGVFKFENNVWSIFLHNNFEVLDISVRNDSIYSLLKNSLFLFHNNANENLYSQSGKSFNRINVPDNGNALIASSEGVIQLNDSDTVIYKPNGPLSNIFLDIATDVLSNVWIGSGSGSAAKGVFKFDGSTWVNYTKDNVPEFNSNTYHNVYAAPDNTKYFGNWGFGFTRLRNEVFETFDASNTDMVGVANNNNFIVIQDVRTDSKNNAWILNSETASRNPLSVLTATGNNMYHYSLNRVAPSNVVLVDHLVVDQFDTKWFAVTRDGTLGLYHFNEKGTFEDLSDDEMGVVRQNNGLNNNDITAIALDNRGELWVGTSLGVNIIPDVSNPYFRISNVFPLRQYTITCIAVDPINRKWIGTNQGVFLMSSDGTFLIDHFNSKNSPLPGNQIKSIDIDGTNGKAYIGTEFGLSSLTTSAIEPNETFTELFVFPNPFIIENELMQVVQIDGLIAESEIKILTIDGKLVKEFSSPGGKIAQWDGKDYTGAYVSSGIYLIVAFDEEANNVTTTKIAVLKN